LSTITQKKEKGGNSFEVEYNFTAREIRMNKSIRRRYGI